MQKNRIFYTSIICPLTILSVYGYSAQTLGTLDFGNHFFGILSSAVFRAFAGICVGSLTYDGCECLKNSNAKTKKPLVLLEVLLWICVVLIFFVKGEEYSPDVLFAVPVFALIVMLCFADRTPIAHFLNTNYCKTLTYLGSLSLYLYLFHWPVLMAMKMWLPNNPFAPAVYCAITFAVSAIAKLLFDRRKSQLPVCVAVCIVIASAFLYAAVC